MTQLPEHISIWGELADVDHELLHVDVGGVRTRVLRAGRGPHLVLLHGTMDDNVHEQNVIQLLWALQTAGKTDFELMLYPRSKHGVDPKLRWHAQYMEWNALRKLRDGKLADG